jgi:hypothetical protein
VLQHNPHIGRPVSADTKELVIGHRAHGYVALYRYIGVLVPGAQATASHLTAAFTQGLREHGYVDGQNVVVERRFGDNRAERISEIAADWCA